MIELEHSPLGGSAAHRFLNCAFSFLEHRRQLQDGQFEDLPSEFAERGTGAHELASDCLHDGKEPFEYLGKEFNGFKAGWADGIDLDAVTVYVNHCRDLMEANGADIGNLNLYIERTIKLPEIHPLLKGTLDFGLITPVMAFLRDYKNGEGIGVSAVSNEQLLYYAFLMVMATPGMRFKDRSYPISLGIVQPNFYGIFEEPDVWETTLGYVMDWGHDVLLQRMSDLSARSVSHGEDDANPGDWCQFCPVMLECPKLKKAFLEYADQSEDFISMLSNEEIDALYAQRENARRFMKALEQVAYARLVGGGKITSGKLVEKQTARVWKPGAGPVLEKTFGLQAYKPREILSPAGIEKLSTRGKEIALEWGYKPEANGLTIAPLSDRRPEAKPRTNANVFEAHTQTPEDMGF